MIWSGDNGGARGNPTRGPVEVCDSCLTVAYDNGIESYEEQANALRAFGGELEDHLCDAVEAPEAVPACGCACYRPQRRSNPGNPPYFVRIPSEGVKYGPYRNLTNTKTFARIGSQHGKPREVYDKGRRIRRYEHGKRTWPRENPVGYRPDVGPADECPECGRPSYIKHVCPACGAAGYFVCDVAYADHACGTDFGCAACGYVQEPTQPGRPTFNNPADRANPRCEDYPACGHGPPPWGDGGGCPDRSGRFRCVECGGLLPKNAPSSICARCRRRFERDPYGDFDRDDR